MRFRSFLLVLAASLVSPLLVATSPLCDACYAQESATTESADLDLTLKHKAIRASLHRDTSVTPPRYLFSMKVPRDAALSVFNLTDPTRLVIDLLQMSIPRNETFVVDKDPFLGAIRFGAHPDRMRIVLDLKSPLPPIYSWAQKGDLLNLTIQARTRKAIESPTPAAVTPVVATPEATPKQVEKQPQIVSVIRQPPSAGTPEAEIASEEVIDSETAPDADSLSLPEESLHSSPTPKTPIKQATQIPAKGADVNAEEILDTIQSLDTPLPESTPEEAATEVIPEVEEPVESQEPTDVEPTLPAPQKTAKPSAQVATSESVESENTSLREKIGDQQALLDIKFDYQIQDKTPVVRLLLNKTTNFSLIKKNSKAYMITIPDCILPQSRLGLAQYPPSDFVGFTFIQPEKLPVGLGVTIGVEAGTRVSAFARGTEVWIKATK